MGRLLEIYAPNYIGDEFIYFREENGKIILYDRPVIPPNTHYNYWILYKNISEDYTEELTARTSNWQTIEARQLHRKRDIFYRSDIGNYFVGIICMFLLLKFGLNVVTSVIQKGGLFNGF